jgi:hypothetical protein
MANNDACGGCRFFEFWDEVNGWCRRHAPKPVTKAIRDGDEDDTNEDHVTEWPSTYRLDWCGEFKRRRWWRGGF